MTNELRDENIPAVCICSTPGEGTQCNGIHWATDAAEVADRG